MDFDKLYTDNFNNIKSVAFRYMKNWEEAEDAAQETFLKASQSMDSFNSDSSVTTWLTSICINTCLNLIESKNRNKRGGGRVISATMADGSTDWLDAPDSASPESIVSSEESMEAVEKAVQSLQDNVLLAMEYRHVDDMSYVDISEKMGVPIGTIKTWLNRGKKHILDAIDPQG